VNPREALDQLELVGDLATLVGNLLLGSVTCERACLVWAHITLTGQAECCRHRP